MGWLGVGVVFLTEEGWALGGGGRSEVWNIQPLSNADFCISGGGEEGVGEGVLGWDTALVLISASSERTCSSAAL